MVIYKQTHVCEHSWCYAPFNPSTDGQKGYPAICRLCGSYSLRTEIPEQTPDPVEYYQIENLFRQREEGGYSAKKAEQGSKNQT